MIGRNSIVKMREDLLTWCKFELPKPDFKYEK